MVQLNVERSQSHCLWDNLSLPPGLSPVILTHIHLTPTHTNAL